MNICLIRHAEAETLPPESGRSDADRPLTDKGWRQTAVLSGALQGHGVRPVAVVVSPLLRSRQTAEGLLRPWPGPAPELLECKALAPGSKPRKLERFVRGLEADTVLLIGHQPDLGRFAGYLIGARGAHLRFAKAGAALIEFEGGPLKGEGLLRWLVTPTWCAGHAGPSAQAG